MRGGWRTSYCRVGAINEHETEGSAPDSPVSRKIASPAAAWWEAPVELFHLRLILLLAMLAGVVVFAIRDVQNRHARTEWKRTLNVALVIVRVGVVDDAAVVGVERRAKHLEEVLTRELHRYRDTPEKPFALSVFGPVDALPAPQPGDGIAAEVKQAWEMHRWRTPIDDELGLDADAYDSRVYLVVRPAGQGQQFVEGASEQGGRIGMTDVELDKSMVDFALFVSAHELLHTLGAVDRYDETGHTFASQGPKPKGAILTEVMGHGRPSPTGVDMPPESLDELWVSPETAKEIGW